MPGHRRSTACQVNTQDNRSPRTNVEPISFQNKQRHPQGKLWVWKDIIEIDSVDTSFCVHTLAVVDRIYYQVGDLSEGMCYVSC